ncbi:MAG TPA: tail fiber domain-containing protein [Candidatus Babeliales bacterium]|jgi:hypothetical protein|nr:tail fiber domain-containing protein [Candidatus Babeliales bacterium]
MNKTIPDFLITFAVLCVGVLPNADALTPQPDGGYANFTTAEGTKALQSLTSGVANTAVGWGSLFSDSIGNFNTAVGAGALDLDTGDNNTATGAAALLFNTVGTQNTANGTAALEFNDTGGGNTANGAFALFSNTGGQFNTAVGYEALFNNTSGTGNIALGASAGGGITIGSDNIDIGNPGAAESNVIRIGFNQTKTFIAGVNSVPVTGTAVTIDGSGQLGVAPSSRRFKEQIKSMDTESETILALKPVTFHYKKEIDPKSTAQFGLVAEEVEKINPDLVVCDKEGRPYSVRYDQVNAMLLNEFLKEHRKNEEQEVTIASQEKEMMRQRKGFESKLAQQQQQIEKLTAGLQNVSAQLEAIKPAPQMVNNP